MNPNFCTDTGPLFFRFKKNIVRAINKQKGVAGDEGFRVLDIIYMRLIGQRDQCKFKPNVIDLPLQVFDHDDLSDDSD